jgi:hypothetical protein
MPGILSYQEQLDKQLRFLETSCREFDAGNQDEAIRIAAAMRVMFHTTDKSTSLLTHLGAAGLAMLSTAGKRPGNHANGYWPSLVQVDIDLARVTLTARPKMDATRSVHRMLPFSAWWDGDVICVAAARKIKRKGLVLAAVNKDGGAHVDSNVPPDYGFFLDGAAFSFKVEHPTGEKVETHLLNAHLACLRQIAYEVLNSPGLRRLAGR